MRRQTQVSFMAGHAGRLACAAALVLAASPLAAQTSELAGLRVETGLYSYFTGTQRSVKVTVTEAGGRAVQSRVRIVLLDAADRIVAARDGVLERARPVSFELPLHMSDAQTQLRAVVTFIGLRDRPSAPIVVVEHVDLNSFTIGTNVTCSPARGQSSSVEPYCPDAVISTFAVGQ